MGILWIANILLGVIILVLGFKNKEKGEEYWYSFLVAGFVIGIGLMGITDAL